MAGPSPLPGRRHHQGSTEHQRGCLPGSRDRSGRSAPTCWSGSTLSSTCAPGRSSRVKVNPATPAGLDTPRLSTHHFPHSTPALPRIWTTSSMNPSTRSCGNVCWLTGWCSRTSWRLTRPRWWSWCRRITGLTGHFPTAGPEPHPHWPGVPQLDTVEEVMHAFLKDPEAQCKIISPSLLLEGVVRSLPDETVEWANYWRERYGVRQRLVDSLGRMSDDS